MNTGEQLIGSYTITLSSQWPSKARVTPAELPQGMSLNTSIGCGKSPILSPGQQCIMSLNYRVPGVTKSTLVNQGPIVCTEAKLVHCSKANAQNRLNMQINFNPIANILLKGLQSLLLGNSTGDLNQWFKINQAENYNSTAYGNGRWITVGSVNTNNKTNILTSTDGKNWTPISLSNSSVVLYIAYYADSVNEWLLGGRLALFIIV